MNPSRHIELDIDIGADARDWSAIQAQEKLKPMETELRRIEELVNEIVSEMDYLRQREQKLRDTNESTNERVKWFAFGTMGMLVGLGAWQVVYLRAYFRYVQSQQPQIYRNSTDVPYIDRSTSSRLQNIGRKTIIVLISWKVKVDPCTPYNVESWRIKVLGIAKALRSSLLRNLP